MDKFTNPIEELREELGMTRRELAVATGVSYGVIANAELGMTARLAPVLMAGLERIGADPAALSAAYEAWRQREGARLVGKGA